ncbi:hypothetical protein ZWY2020_027014 [Hordeum vulgare]|nr:hypothetical protein ZWY2020_027014 [Hordeum vulgare]
MPIIGEESTCRAASLIDDLLVEILSRLEVKPLCCFKCVFKTWDNLISDTYHYKKLPQTLVGLFYDRHIGQRIPICFGIVSPACKTTQCFSPILPSSHPCMYQHTELSDSCNGLLLYRCFKSMGNTGTSWSILPLTSGVCCLPPARGASCVRRDCGSAPSYRRPISTYSSSWSTKTNSSLQERYILLKLEDCLQEY